ncbi:MAG: zf-HC2 domain-containing protein, partial [Alphaproteobacteria bacterium]
MASDALERELSVWEAFRLRLHLLLCGRCRNFRRSL